MNLVTTESCSTNRATFNRSLFKISIIDHLFSDSELQKHISYQQHKIILLVIGKKIDTKV